MMYPPNIRRVTQIESDQLIGRLLSCLPAATFEMETFCRLAGIKASRRIPTAAVEVGHRSHMLLNPDFVNKYCKRDEHLFLLVMHELWHIILAHTRLYPRATMANNIAFDAIINAGLSRQFTGPEYRGFFEALNPADNFPSVLLRPPPGWPENPVYPDVGPPGTRRVLERLYPRNNKARVAAPLYEEILALIKEDLKQKIERGEVVIEPVLIGDHDSADGEAGVLDDPLMKEVLRRTTQAWPAPPFATRKRGDSVVFTDWFSAIGPSSEEARRVFSRVLQRALGPRTGKQKRKARVLLPGISGMNVLPNPRDRMVTARRRLGVQGVLYGQPGLIRARAPERPARSHVYLDVSGSMANLLPHLLGLLVPYAAKGYTNVFQFSNKVEPMPTDELKRGKIRTTQGTDINCVLRHLLENKPFARKALIVTDGYVGKPHPEYIRAIRERGIRIYVVLPAESAYKDDMTEIARSFTVLPRHSAKASPWHLPK
ncbi:MAG: VWA domain-containing protein [Chloroflexota bacterium]|nr:VWA domain-containing protein [Chloroflexota bacterium]